MDWKCCIPCQGSGFQEEDSRANTGNGGDIWDTPCETCLGTGYSHDYLLEDGIIRGWLTPPPTGFGPINLEETLNGILNPVETLNKVVYYYAGDQLAWKFKMCCPADYHDANDPVAWAFDAWHQEEEGEFPPVKRVRPCYMRKNETVIEFVDGSFMEIQDLPSTYENEAQRVAYWSQNNMKGVA